VDESSYGLIVEGIYDETVFPEFVRKVVSRDLTIIVRACGGVSKLMMRLPGYLTELEYAWYGRPVAKAIVIRDWRDTDLASAEQAMSQKIQGRNFSFPHGIQFCAVRQEMETWLLADGNAINSVAQARGGRLTSQTQGQLEEISEPKERLIKLLTEAKLPYDPKVCAEIAREASIERLRYRCPAFGLFEQKVIDC
jgi:hypothetical protein